MTANTYSKNEFTEDEKYHNLMSWLKWPLEKSTEKGSEGNDSNFDLFFFFPNRDRVNYIYVF